MICESCKYWKPAYAPFAAGKDKLIMTCHKDKIYTKGGCKHWERKEDEYGERTS